MADTPRDEVIAEHILAPIDVALERDNGNDVVVMRREFVHTPEKLWQLLTQPELLAHWSPIVPNRVLDSVGPATSRENPDDAPVDAEVLSVAAPYAVTHRWDTEVLDWEITPSEHSSIERGSSEQGSVLQLRQSVGDPEFISMMVAGWQVCFGRLAAEEDGVDRERVVDERAMDYGWNALNEHYQATLSGN